MTTLWRGLRGLAVCCLFSLSTVDCLQNKELPLTVRPLVIKSLLYVEHISSFNLQEMEYRIDYFLDQFWSTDIDTCKSAYLLQLPYEGDQSELREEYLFTGSEVSALWTPDTYMADAKRVHLTDVANNKMLNITVVENRCAFKYSTRLAAVVTCQMDFSNYPNDVQECPFRLTSLFYPTSMMVNQWEPPGVRINLNRVKLNQYEITASGGSYNASNYDGVNYSWLVLKFTLRRRLSHFVVQMVLPTFLIVFVAYTSFWIRLDSGPGRYLLTILPFLSLITIFNGLKGQLPPVSYANGIDVWMLISMSFVFTAIVELAIAAFLSHQDKRRKLRLEKEREKGANPEDDLYSYRSLEEGHTSPETIKNVVFVNHCAVKCSEMMSPCSCCQSPASESLTGLTSKQAPLTFSHLPDRALYLDQVFRVIYPLSYCLFNAFYWHLLLSRKLF